jgi:hypothetical protein
MLQMIEVVRSNYISQIPETFHQGNRFSTIRTANRIGGLVVKLAVAIHHRTVSASPGFDSRPMHFASIVDCGRWC